MASEAFMEKNVARHSDVAHLVEHRTCSLRTSETVPRVNGPRRVIDTYRADSEGRYPERLIST